MPVRGPLTHIDLSISDPDRAIPFYEALLLALGYERLDISAADFQGPRPRRAAWRVRLGSGASFGIEVRPSSGPDRTRPNDRYAPGMHHMAFHAESSQDVEDIHRVMVTAGATVLDAPADYTGQRGYSPGYYAAFYADPDGIKIEVAHIPGSNP
jgi:catechol 2,3-dioxygenase-like lactoylglutathione lyase family enzyme